MRPLQSARAAFRRLALMVATGLLGALALAPPAQAQVPDDWFGPEQTITTRNACGGNGAWSGDVGAGGDGVTRGFVSYVDPQCPKAPGRGDPIVYFERSGPGWRSVQTPYVGDVLAVAADVTGTTLLYDSRTGTGQAGNGLRITKRLADGTFTAGRELSKAFAGDGDVIVSGGKWWAVWSQPGANGALANLYQARSMGSAMAARRITTNTADDVMPALARRGDGRAVMAWSKRIYVGPGRANSRSAVWRAEADRAGRWTSAKLPRQPALSVNEQPEVAIYRHPRTGGETTYIAWRDGKPGDTQIVTSRNWALRQTDDMAPARLLAVSATNYELAGPDLGVMMAFRGQGGVLHLPVSNNGRDMVIGLTQRAGRTTVVYARPGPHPTLFARTANQKLDPV